MEQRKHLIGKIRDQNAGIPAVIIIGCIDSHARARQAFFAVCNAGIYCRLGKPSPFVVNVKFVWLRIVGYHEVRPAVVVVVENSYA